MMKNLENKKIEIELKTSLRKYPAGMRLKILVDKNGTPFERYWRDRFKDAKIDGCVAIVETKKKKKKRSTED